MTPERLNQIRQVFLAALSLAATERSSYLDEVCAGDLELRQDVEKLLASPTSTLDPPAGVNAAWLFDRRPEDPLLSKDAGRGAPRLEGRLGKYEIQELLASGGMGEAAGEWKALQRNPRALASGARLVVLSEWAASRLDALSAVEREFLEASERQGEVSEAKRQQKLAEVEARADEERTPSGKAVPIAAWSFLRSVSGSCFCCRSGSSGFGDEAGF